jgi:CHASE3 domain sensor protein
MNLSIGKGVAFGFTVAPVALLAISTVSYRNLVELTADSRWVEHTLQVIQRADTAFADSMQAENSIRGYALTGDPTF